MKIAIPANEKDINSEVCISFGRAPYYMFYDTQSDTALFMANTAANAPGGAGIKAAQSIVDNKADVLLTPRCGDNAAQVIHSSGIRMFKTKPGSLMDNVEAFKNNELEPLADIHPGLHNHR
jgi:predicted outer membrane repeat protein